MFSYISGTLVSKHPTSAVIDVAGIGYALSIPASSYQALPEVGARARLYVHLHVREDVFALYGFASEPERVIFDQMLAVSGVGPRLALAALSALGASELREVIVAGDVQALTRIPGVGRKTAERLALELKDRFSRVEIVGLPAEEDHRPRSSEDAARSDAVLALESLGLARSAAERSLRKALQSNPGPHTAEELVRLALRES